MQHLSTRSTCIIALWGINERQNESNYSSQSRWNMCIRNARIPVSPVIFEGVGDFLEVKKKKRGLSRTRDYFARVFFASKRRIILSMSTPGTEWLLDIRGMKK